METCSFVNRYNFKLVPTWNKPYTVNVSRETLQDMFAGTYPEFLVKLIDLMKENEYGIKRANGKVTTELRS